MLSISRKNMQFFIIYKYLYYDIFLFHDKVMKYLKYRYSSFAQNVKESSRIIGQARFNTPSRREQLTLWRDRRTWITVSKSDVWPCTYNYSDRDYKTRDILISRHGANGCWYYNLWSRCANLLLTRVTVYPRRVINSCMRSELISFRKVLERNINWIYILHARVRNYISFNKTLRSSWKRCLKK